MNIDILTVGDALIDIFLFLNTNNEHCHVNEKLSEICFVVGSKIPLEDSKFLLGGNACNTAVGFSRLGLKTALAAEIGDDEFSKKILLELQREHIETRCVKQTAGTQTSFSIDLTFLKDRTILSQHFQRTHDLPIEEIQPGTIYLTSLGEDWKTLYRKVYTYVQNNKVTLAFNPGSHQLKQGVASFQDILTCTTILFINREEAEDMLYGKDQEIDEVKKKPEVLLQGVKELGPKIVSMTDGENGSYLIDEDDTIYFQKSIPCEFVQKTGVGDAYASGFLAAYVQQQKIQEAMEWGACNSAAVIEHIGAQTGLLTKQQLLERMEKFKSEQHQSGLV